MEKMLKLHKFLRILETVFSKILEKFFLFPEIDQEIKKSMGDLEDFLFGFFKECLSNIEALVKETKEKNEKILDLNQKLEEIKGQFSNQMNDHIKKINESTEAQFKKILKKTSLNEIYYNYENQKLEKEIEVLRSALQSCEKNHNIEEVLEKFNNFKEKSDEKIKELSINIQKKDLIKPWKWHGK